MSLLDPDSSPRPANGEQMTYRLWKKHKIISKPNFQAPIELGYREVAEAPKETLTSSPPTGCCQSEARVQELTNIVDRQQFEINELRSDYLTLKRNFEELLDSFKTLATTREDKPTIAPETPDFRSMNKNKPRWSLPDSAMDMAAVINKVAAPDHRNDIDQNGAPATLDKSLMMNNLIIKYFPKDDRIHPANGPVMENHSEVDKSIATMNYLNKYKLQTPTTTVKRTEKFLDITRLKNQSKLVNYNLDEF